MNNFRIVSWNVQGLGGAQAQNFKARLRQNLHKSFMRSVDIVFLQEHHLSSTRIDSYGSLFTGSWAHFWSPAIGESHNKAGVCIALAQKWYSHVIDYKILVEGRVQFIILEIQNLQLGFINVYAHNATTDRRRLWSYLCDTLPQVDHWCMAGDFNMIEDKLDRSGGSQAVLYGSELSFWERLCFKYGFQDTWCSPSFNKHVESLQFSRSDRRVLGVNISRLDRFYADDFFIALGGSLQILAGTTFSDHSPLIVTLKKVEKGKSFRTPIPSSLYVDVNLRGEVLAMWKDTDVLHLMVCDRVANAIVKVSNWFNTKAKEERGQLKTKILSMKRAVISLQHFQQRMPWATWVVLELNNAKDKLGKLQDNWAQCTYNAFAAKWAQVGDKVSADFFKFVTPKRTCNGMKQLQRDDGSITEDAGEMRDIATKFYSNLLTAECFTLDQLEKQRDVWQSMQPRVSLNMTNALVKPILISEVRAALDAIGSHVCPGTDGLSAEFFRNYWEFIGTDITAAFQEVFDTGFMPSKWTEGMIYLIPKMEGVVADIRKWRPITILNTIYKMYAKLLAMRLQPFLSDIIHNTQTGFLQDRSILDNIFLFWEAVAISQERKEELAILLLDFEKAYDRVDWSFLRGTMEKLGFPNQWLTAVSALYNSATSRVLVDGELGQAFVISRSVRQGCPLAPFLYLMIGEAFSSFLTSDTVNIKGLQWPWLEEQVVDCQFADDTALYLQGSSDNLSRVQHAIDTFCYASGTIINWNKSMGFWVGSIVNPVWCPQEGFQWIPHGKPIRYLGCQVGINISPEDHVAPLLIAIRKKLVYWNTAKLSLAGRVVIANQVLLASMWYILSAWLGSRSALSQVQRLIRNFLWGSKDCSDVRAKVSWKVITTPKDEGGLGLIDPLLQCKALVGKFIIRGLLPGGEPWKKILRQRMVKVVPSTGGNWKDSIRWWFLRDFNHSIDIFRHDKFFRGIMKAWWDLKQYLVQSPPSCKEE